MRRIFWVLPYMIAAAFSAGAADGPPGWAYGFPPNPAPAANPAGVPGGGGGRGGRGPQAPPDTSVKHLDGSKLEFTRTQINDGFGPADWFPEDHPQMPDIVAHGRRPDVRACALCHYPNGKGRAENAGVSGLSVAYFIQQMNDFKDGNRKSAEPRKSNTNAMASLAKAMTGEEIKAAAEYFGSIQFTPWIKMIEATMAPRTRIAGGLFLVMEGGEQEPLGQRIIEVPESAEMTETLRNPRSGFLAYAPVGSVKKGEALAASGQCGLCHGDDLKGIGPVPAIAGRSSSYLMRQMVDMQQGTRKGLWTGLMKPAVAHLSEEELMNLAAYVASRTP